MVELRNPKYDTSNNTATYDVALLQDWRKLDGEFAQTPDDAANLPRDFTAAHLFIDDCADGIIPCVRNGESESTAKVVSAVAYCWDWEPYSCKPCHDPATICNIAYPDYCQGNCREGTCNFWGCR